MLIVVTRDEDNLKRHDCMWTRCTEIETFDELREITLLEIDVTSEPAGFHRELWLVSQNTQRLTEYGKQIIGLAARTPEQYCN